MTESINQLITLCTQQAPGQKECDNALRELEVLLQSRKLFWRAPGPKCLIFLFLWLAAVTVFSLRYMAGVLLAYQVSTEPLWTSHSFGQSEICPTVPFSSLLPIKYSSVIIIHNNCELKRSLSGLDIPSASRALKGVVIPWFSVLRRLLFMVLLKHLVCFSQDLLWELGKRRGTTGNCSKYSLSLTSHCSHSFLIAVRM